MVLATTTWRLNATFLCGLFLLLGCGSSKNASLEQSGWNLIWEENFDKDDFLDPAKWNVIERNTADWGNYMSQNEDCIHIKDGKLFLRGIINPDRSKDTVPYLTGGVSTKGKFAYQYGKIEIKAKLESAKGAWPALWTLVNGLLTNPSIL